MEKKTVRFEDPIQKPNKTKLLKSVQRIYNFDQKDSNNLFKQNKGKNQHISNNQIQQQIQYHPKTEGLLPETQKIISSQTESNFKLNDDIKQFAITLCQNKSTLKNIATISVTESGFQKQDSIKQSQIESDQQPYKLQKGKIESQKNINYSDYQTNKQVQDQNKFLNKKQGQNPRMSISLNNKKITGINQENHPIRIEIDPRSMTSIKQHLQQNQKKYIQDISNPESLKQSQQENIQDGEKKKTIEIDTKLQYIKPKNKIQGNQFIDASKQVKLKQKKQIHQEKSIQNKSNSNFSLKYKNQRNKLGLQFGNKLLQKSKTINQQKQQLPSTSINQRMKVYQKQIYQTPSYPIKVNDQAMTDRQLIYNPSNQNIISQKEVQLEDINKKGWCCFFCY